MALTIISRMERQARLDGAADDPVIKVSDRRDPAPLTLTLNPADVEALREAFGASSSRWIGERVRVVQRWNPDAAAVVPVRRPAPPQAQQLGLLEPQAASLF